MMPEDKGNKDKPDKNEKQDKDAKQQARDHFARKGAQDKRNREQQQKRPETGHRLNDGRRTSERQSGTDRNKSYGRRDGKQESAAQMRAREKMLNKMSKPPTEHSFDTGATSPIGKLIDQAGKGVVERASGQAANDTRRAFEIREAQQRIRDRAEKRNQNRGRDDGQEPPAATAKRR